MIHDSERREMARRLREPFDIIGEGRYVALNGTLFGMQLLAGDEGTLRAGIARLADLIEPSERACYYYDAETNHCRCYDMPQNVAEEMFGKMRHSTKEEADAYEAMLKSVSVEIHPVDRDALLALADDIDKQTDGSMFDIWLEDGHYIARRIREALGVEHG